MRTFLSGDNVGPPGFKEASCVNLGGLDIVHHIGEERRGRKLRRNVIKMYSCKPGSEQFISLF